MANTNLEMLRVVVERLGGLADELVFVGGCTTGLLITDPAASEVRPTDDVDAIVEAATYAQYTAFSERLRGAGFSNDTSEDAPICRWIGGGVKLDVMPVTGEFLGFTNTWYEAAVKTAEPVTIAPGVSIRVVTPPYFCATKLEAFTGRGNNDFLASHDLEDLISVIDGRPELVDELRNAPDDVRKFIGAYIRDLIGTREFLDALPGHLPPDAASQGRIGILVDRLTRISNL